MKCNPLRWLWGLIPVFALSWLAVQLEHGRIETDLAARVTERFKASGLGYPKVAFTGRDGLITGEASDESEPLKAREITEGVWGVRLAEDRSALIEKVTNFNWSATRTANAVQLRGMAPNEATRQSIVGLVRSTFPAAEVVDQMTIRRGVPSQDTWLSGVSFGIKQLAGLKTGEARLDGLALAVSGEAETLDTYKGVKTALANQLPRGIRLTDEKVSAPIVKPYVWGARALGRQLTLTGYVPGERVREEILSAAKSAFPSVTIADQMQVAEGAPSGFVNATLAALRQLARLEEGRADASDVKLTLAGTANDAATADQAREGLRTGVPQTFTLVDLIRVREMAPPTPPVMPVAPPPPPAPTPPVVAQVTPPPPPAPPPAAAPVAPPVVSPAPPAPAQSAPAPTSPSVAVPKPVSPFVTSVDLDRARVVLTGYVPSPAAKDLLESAAKARFPGRAIDNRVEVADGAPAGWQGCVEAGMIGLQKASTGKVALTDRRLAVTGVTDDDEQIEAAPGNVRMASQGACDSEVSLTAAPEPDLDWRAVYNGQQLTLSGDVTSATAKRALAEQAARLAPNARVVDQMRVVDHGSRKWPQVADAGLRILADLKSGEARLSRQRLTVSGEAADQSIVVGARERLGRLARGYDGKEEIKVAVAAPPPPPPPTPPPAPAVQPPAPPIVDPKARACQDGLRTAAKEGMINFERAKADLSRDSLPTLNKLAQIARDCPQVRIEIEGHTDAEGTPERNQRLADRRARAVADYLIRAGVDAGKLAAVGYGETRPVAPNDTPENRARNRRIEFTVRE